MEKTRKQLVISSNRSCSNMIDLLFVVFCFFLFISMFNVSKNGFLSTVGAIGMILLTIPAILALVSSAFLKNKRFPFIFMIVFVVVFCSGIATIIITKSTDPARIIAQYLVIFGIYAFSIQMNKRKLLRLTFYVVAATMIMAIIDQLLSMKSGNYILFINPNKIGMISFIFACFVLISNKKNSIKLISILISVVLLLLCNSRTPMFVLFVGIIIYGIFSCFSDKINNILFVIFLLALIVFIVVYVKASEIPFFIKMNEWVLDVTGKNFFSGRQAIWKNVLTEYDTSKLLFGYGLGSSLSAFNPEWEYSTHNQILEIFVQQGIFGVILLYSMYIIMFINIKKKYKGNVMIKTIFVMSILYNMFEVFLFQNGFNIGILIWIISFCGFGCGIFGERIDCSKKKIEQISVAKKSEEKCDNYTL